MKDKLEKLMKFENNTQGDIKKNKDLTGLFKILDGLQIRYHYLENSHRLLILADEIDKELAQKICAYDSDLILEVNKDYYEVLQVDWHCSGKLMNIFAIESCEKLKKKVEKYKHCYVRWGIANLKTIEMYIQGVLDFDEITHDDNIYNLADSGLRFCIHKWDDSETLPTWNPYYYGVEDEESRMYDKLRDYVLLNEDFYLMLFNFVDTGETVRYVNIESEGEKYLLRMEMWCPEKILKKIKNK